MVRRKSYSAALLATTQTYLGICAAHLTTHPVCQTRAHARTLACSCRHTEERIAELVASKRAELEEEAAAAAETGVQQQQGGK